MSGLKTLKDIMIEQSGGARVYPMIKEGKIPNTSDKIYLDAIGVIGIKLKEAAKEWLLDLQESIGDSTGDYTDVENMEREAQIEWIETFFNLEDDD
jgi:hypothetical protein